MDVAWRVVTTVPTTGFDASGRAVAGRNVTYQMGTGETGTVFVPNSVTDEAAQKAIIMADANNVAQLGSLSSGS